jgi:hypothetical protein
LPLENIAPFVRKFMDRIVNWSPVRRDRRARLMTMLNRRTMCGCNACSVATREAQHPALTALSASTMAALKPVRLMTPLRVERATDARAFLSGQPFARLTSVTATQRIEVFAQ